MRHNYICWFLCLCRKILKVKGESNSIFFLLMLGCIQSNIEGVYNGKKIFGKKGSLIFVHVQFMGTSSNMSVIKVTIT